MHITRMTDSLVSFAPGDADELLDAACVSQCLGVLHVLGDDLVQGAADRRHRVVRHGFAGCAVVGATAAGVTAPRKTVDQIPHRILPYEVREEKKRVNVSSSADCCSRTNTNLTASCNIARMFPTYIQDLHTHSHTHTFLPIQVKQKFVHPSYHVLLKK